jgi:hypothetical protein
LGIKSQGRLGLKLLDLETQGQRGVVRTLDLSEKRERKKKTNLSSHVRAEKSKKREV